MSLFWKRRAHIEADSKTKEASSNEVTKLNRQTHQTADQANRDINKLNDLLRANGITLKIHIASGGHRGK